MQNINPKTTYPQAIHKEKIKFPILAPLTAAILLLLWIFTLAIYNLQQRHITDEVRMRLDSTRGFFNEQLATDARLLDAIISFIENDPNIQSIWLTKDRNTLLDYTTPLFEKFRRDYKITHFYFIDANNTCFLRVHNPASFGDRIDRFTLLAAGRDQKPSWGIELGPFGTFTLRQVHPWFVNDTLVGFIELGEEISHITPQLKKGFDVDLVFLIKKSFLTRDGWEQGLKVMGRSGNWDLIPDRVIVDSTIPVIPPEFIQFAGTPHEQHKDQFVSAAFNGSTYRAGCVQLIDAAGRSVGDILVIKNISKDQASLRTLLATVAVICFGIGALLIVLFYIHINRIEKRLLNAHASLESEIEKRKVVEAELRRHRDGLEETIKNRTAELKEINKHLQVEITERKKAEQSLRKSEQRFKQVAESAGDWIWEVNAEGLYTYSSPVAENLLGYKPEEIVGKKYFYDFFAPDVKESLKKAAFEAFNKKERFSSFVNSNIHKNGSTVILETTGITILDDEGNLCGYRGADRDITERKQAEEDLKSSLSLLRASLESTADGILIVDRKGKLTRWNQKFVDMWKISEEVLSSRDDEKTINHILAQLADPEQFVAKVRKLYEQPEESSFDQIEFLDGRVFDRYSQPQRIGDDIVGRVWSFRDITERKRAEQRQTETLEQLEKTNSRLQQEVAQRTKAETSLAKLNNDLEFTVDQLSRSNKQLRDFAHLTAHDLKTPLRGIGMLAQWLAKDYRDKFDDDGRRQIDLLVKRVERMDNFINAVLQYSTIARNSRQEHRVDLNLLLRVVLASIQPPQNIEITVNKNLPAIICSERHIAQVFNNLISNAVKFMDKTEGHISIDCNDEIHFWKFSVSDNGPGIEPQHFDRIFRLFQTLTDRDHFDTTGAGLALTKKIVELYDGRVWLVSQPGQGSTFFFTLPKQPAAVARQTPQPAAT